MEHSRTCGQKTAWAKELVLRRRGPQDRPRTRSDVPVPMGLGRALGAARGVSAASLTHCPADRGSGGADEGEVGCVGDPPRPCATWWYPPNAVSCTRPGPLLPSARLQSRGGGGADCASGAGCGRGIPADVLRGRGGGRAHCTPGPLHTLSILHSQWPTPPPPPPPPKGPLEQ